MYDAYADFAALIAARPDVDNAVAISVVMKASNGRADPNLVTVWWRQWQQLKQAVQANGRAKDNI